MIVGRIKFNKITYNSYNKILVLIAIIYLAIFIWFSPRDGAKRDIQIQYNRKRHFIGNITKGGVVEPLNLEWNVTTNKLITTTVPFNSELCKETMKNLNMTRWNFLSNHKNPCWRVKFESGNKILYKVVCVPYFFVAGFPKCGTTDLFERMSLHPQFIAPPYKELHWFTRFRFRQHRGSVSFDELEGLDRSLYMYTNMFANVSVYNEKEGYNKQITGDFSPSTIWDSDAYISLDINKGLTIPRYINADFVAKVNPCAKIIVLMRDPVQRLYSDYLHFIRHPNISPEDFHRRVIISVRRFTKCLKVYELRHCLHNYTLEHGGVRLRVGIYYAYIEDWLQRFVRSQFLFLRLEDYASNISYHMERIFEFLDMEKASPSLLEEISRKMPSNTKTNRIKGKIKPMLNSTQRLLRAFYKPFNLELANLLYNKSYLW